MNCAGFETAVPPIGFDVHGLAQIGPSVGPLYIPINQNICIITNTAWLEKKL